jgi:hypothetical protein
MCNCIKELENLLTQKMQEQYPEADGWEVVEKVNFQNVSLLNNGWIFYNETIGRVKKNGKITKFKLSVKPEYCPYCGEKLEQEDKK